MKKNNFKFLSMFVAFIFGAIIFVACGQTRGNLTFVEAQIHMAYNEERNIADLVELDGYNINDIVFESNNPEIVLVTPRQTIIAGSQDGVAILTAQGFNGFLEIQVAGTNLKFAQPTNVRFDEVSSSIVWDGVYAGDVVANNFTIKLSKDGELLDESTVNLHAYPVDGEGEFEVQVMCEARDGVRASDYTETYTFTKLPKPTNVKYNSKTGIVSWDIPEGITHFYLKKDGVLSEKLSTNLFELNLTEPATYNISVYSATESENQNVFGSASDALVLTRLSAPQVSVSDGVVSWQDEQEGAIGYNAQVYSVIDGEQNLISENSILKNGNTYSYTMPSLVQGDYVVKVCALGNGGIDGIYTAGTHSLNSAYSQTQITTKLAMQELVFDKQTSTISIKDYDASLDLNLQLIASLNGGEPISIDISSGSVVYNFENAGTYTFYALNVSKSDKEITSEQGNILTVVKLGQITELNQSEDEQGNYILNNLQLANASTFEVSVSYNAGQANVLTTNESGYGLTKDVFSRVGDYVVSVTAKGIDAENYYVLDSVTSLNVTRLSTNALTRDAEQVTWQSSGTSGDIAYAYTVEGIETLGGTLQTNMFDLSVLNVGAYTISVKAIGLNKQNTKSLILDAFNTESLAVEIYRQLESPLLSFERDEDGYNLIVYPVENAASYTITLNSQPYKVESANGLEPIVLAVEGCFAQAGTGANLLDYVFAVYATSNNQYYQQSKTSTVSIVKEFAPTSFNVSDNEVLSIDVPYSHIQKAEILINDEQTNELDTNTNLFNVKVRFIAKIQEYEGVYYIDSDYSEFELERLDVNIKMYGLLATWSASATSQAYTPYLNVVQNDKTFAFALTQIPALDLSTFNLEALGFSLNSAITGYVECVFGKFSGNIAGNYQNGNFVSGNAGVLSKYNLGAKSDFTKLQYANAGIDINVKESANNVNITWQSKTDAEYWLFDGTDEVVGLTNSAQVMSNKLEQEKKYCLSLTEELNGETNVYVFYLTRLSKVNSLTVSDDEKLNANLIFGAVDIQITQNGVNVDSLANVTDTTTVVSVKYVAQDNLNDFEFYLDSASVDYSFARLGTLNTISNLKIYNNIISWTKEGTADTAKYVYNVKFLDEKANENIVVLVADTTNSIDLAQDEYQEILNSLEGAKYISIQKYVGEYVADSEGVNYLSSVYSNDVLLKIIDAPYDVKIELAEDATGNNAIVQNALKITWSIDDTDVEIAGYTVKISHNGKSSEYESTGVFNIDETSELFKTAGVWSVEVRALGANDSILSPYSESVSITRLNESDSLSLTKDGVIAWSSVANAARYMVMHTGAAGENYWFVEKDVVSSDNFKAKLNEEFAGAVTISLYALGDGTNTLTSVKSSVFTRLDKPVITYENDKIIIENYSSYPVKTTIFANAIIDDNVVLNKEITASFDGAINKYVWYYPTQYSYIDGSGKTVSVDLTSQKDIVFTFEARNELVQYINSNKVIKALTVLASIQDIKIARIDGVLHLVANNPNADVTTVKVSVGNLSWAFDGNVDLEISDVVLAQIPESWTFVVNAVGGMVGSKLYIDSMISRIGGTKLKTVSNISTKDGAITWSAVSGATDYKLCVDRTTYLTGYTTTRAEKLAGNQFASGDHIVNIRAIGNVTEAGLSTGIVLDGDYSSGYSLTKLDALSDLTVENGYFTFTTVQQATSYVVVAYNDLTANPIAEYTLTEYTQFPENKNTNGYFYNADLLTKLDEIALTSGQNAKLYIRVYNKTTLENYVYSDYANVVYGGSTYDYVTISRLQNANEQVELYNPLKPDGIYIDYTSTIAKWEQNVNAPNKYILSVDDSTIISTQNSFVLDEDGSWTTGNHAIRYAQIGSNGFDASGHAYLTAAFSQDLTVTKLQSTAPYLARLQGVTQELCISYSTVAGADKYYSYLAGEYFGEYSNAGIAIMMEGMTEGVVYENFAMRAVNTQNVNYIASNPCYLTHFDDETQQEKIVTLAKTRSPKAYTFENGTFYWSFTDEQWLEMLSDQIKIYNWNPLSLSFGQLFTSKFEIRFTSLSSPVTTYTGVDYVKNYIYVSEEQFETICGYIDTLAPTLEMTEEQVYQLKRDILQNFGGGFSSANYNFSKFAGNLPAGDYSIDVKTIGSGLIIYLETRDFEAWFSSGYTNIGVKYVASAPSVTAVANNGKYSLKFTNVNIDKKYFTSGISYNLYATYYNEEYDINLTELVTTLNYATTNNSAELEFALTQLIEDDKLTSKYINLFVTVAGNNTNVLNGKTSNFINIEILNEVTAKIERGIIYWSAQEFASKYQAVYLKAGEDEARYVDFAVEEGTEWYYWIAAELEEASSYAVTLQACGLIDGVINNTETFIMSGKLTPIGTVNKLAGISKIDNGIDIQNGLFVWETIENATAYDVYRYSSNGASIFVESVGKNSYYETSATNQEAYYYSFMSIGTEAEDLTNESNIYVNSNLSGKNLAQRLAGIKSVSFDNAIISFTPTYKTGYYKLTFYKLNSLGEASEPVIVYTTDTNFDTNSDAGLLAAGTYNVDIQAIYQDKKLVETTTNCYYIISAKYNDSFLKFDKVYGINVGEYDITNQNNVTTHYDGGVISWSHDNTENLALSTFEYKLIFTAYTNEGTYIDEVVKTVPSSQKYFEGVVFDELATTDKITLQIYVYPTETAINSNTNYVYSLPVTYGTYADGALIEPTYLHQYMQIDETKLSIGITEKSQLIVDWTQGISGSNTGDFTYEISFAIGGVEHAPMTTNDTFYVIGNEDEGLFADDSSTTVVFKIRVIPTSKDYISSAWTTSKEITRPNAIEGLTYDEETCTITWDAYTGTSNWDSYKYKIRDEVIYTDVNGDQYVEEYIITANLGDEKYTPFVIGTHNISVAVMVSNSNQANTDFISAYKTIENIQFNMFAMGDGTEENPYIILDSEQFKNMQYRMSKDSKLNEYFLTRTVNDEMIVDNQKVVDTLDKYYFKQEGHITLVKNGEIDQTLYNVESDTGFNNIYDADRYSLTLDYIHVDDTADYEHVSIFKLLGEDAEIKNMKLLFKLTATDNNLRGSGDWADISILCEQNNGKIENIMIGNVGDTLKINITYLMFSLSMLASSNYGTITNVQNNYNVIIEDKNINVQQQINYAPIAINNYASVIYAKNNGNITVSGSNMFVGGLVAKNTGTNATIQGGANKGNFDIYYKTSETSYIGGLVAYSEGTSSITYSYNIGDINVQAEAGIALTSAYVGGLVGWAAYDNISYSYVNANFTTTVTNFNIYQLIGKLQVSTSKAVNVYYNATTNVVAVNGTLGSGVKGYTTSPADAELYGTGTLYNKGDLDGVNPRLDWEAKLFETIIWQEDLPQA